MPKKFLTVSKSKDVIPKILSLIDLPIEEEEIDIENALNRYSAEDVVATFDSPPFRKSLVDGFAVRSVDTKGASPGNPIPFKLLGEVHIGTFEHRRLNPSETFFIPTGGAVVDGADAVVMREYTEIHNDEVFIMKEVSNEENVLPIGEDIKKNDVILERGERITPRKIAGMRNFGVKSIRVIKPIRIGIFSTGDELRDEGPLKQGEIYDSNSYTLAAEAKQDGFIVSRYGIVKDNFESIVSMLKKSISQNNVTFMSGGTSKGNFDFTVDAINSLGKPGVVIHGMHLSPGKPTVFGIASRKLIVGFSGNPLASFLVYRNIVRTIIFKKLGLKLKKKVIFAELSENIPSRKGREEYIIGNLINKDGKNIVRPMFSESAFISPLLYGDGIITIPLMSEGLKKGERVVFELW